MAVSPLNPVRSPASKNAATGKAKALTILNNAKPTSAPDQQAASSAPAPDEAVDLAEQFNEETKRRYVKGSYLP